MDVALGIVASPGRAERQVSAIMHLLRTHSHGDHISGFAVSSRPVDGRMVKAIRRDNEASSPREKVKERSLLTGMLKKSAIWFCKAGAFVASGKRASLPHSSLRDPSGRMPFPP